MELGKALTVRLSFNDLSGEIRVDENDYICLNDLVKYFPNRKIAEWKKLKYTRELMAVLDQDLNKGNSPYLKSLIARRGKYLGGTYAHKDIALYFATWLSPEFHLKVLRAYRTGSQNKKNWDIKRILAANNYKLMSQSVQNQHPNHTDRPHHYSNEAVMLNKIVFGRHETMIRDNATEEELDELTRLEGMNSAYIDIGMPFSERRKVLSRLSKPLNLLTA